MLGGELRGKEKFSASLSPWYLSFLILLKFTSFFSFLRLGLADEIQWAVVPLLAYPN